MPRFQASGVGRSRQRSEIHLRRADGGHAGFSGLLRKISVILAVAIGSWASGGTALASSADQSVAYQLDGAHDGYLSNAPLGTPLVQQWSVSLPGAASYPLIVNGAVFVTAADSSGQGTTLYALNQATGSILWSRGLGGTFWWSGLAYDRGQLFTVNTGGTMSAIDPTSGSINWSEQLPGQYFFTSPPSAARGIVYVGGAGFGGTLYAVRELDGHLLWTQPVENGDESSPAVDGTSVYVTYPGQDYAFDAVTGAPGWHHDGGIEGGGGRTAVVAAGLLFARDPVEGNLLFHTPDGSLDGSFTATPAPAVANGLAYMLSGSTLRAVKNSGQGTNSWQFSGDGSLDTAPLVVGGLVFVGSSSGELYALNASTGTTSWSTNVGAAIPAPDEQNVTQPLTGFGAGNGTIVVPAGQSLVEYRTGGAISAAPMNQAAPTIDGTPVVDQMLAADVGVWSGSA
jgi:outer membrane protein assembly factor BamB